MNLYALVSNVDYDTEVKVYSDYDIAMADAAAIIHTLVLESDIPQHVMSQDDLIRWYNTDVSSIPNAVNVYPVSLQK